MSSPSASVRVGDETLAKIWPDPPRVVSRANRYVRAGLIAVRNAIEGHALPAGTGIVLASRTGCRATDWVYHQRLVQEGTARVSRLDFSYTVPVAPAAEAALLFQLRGPLLAFIGPESMAEEEARRWVMQGRAPAMLALVVDAPEPHAPATACCTLIQPLEPS